MRRFASAFLCSCVLIALGVLSVPAQAGEYYRGGYYGGGYHGHRGNVWYSSKCCYKKIIRHETSARYVRVDEARPYYRNGYYDRPYRSSYYDRPYRSGYYYSPPRRYVDDGYVTRRYVSSSYYDDGGGYYGRSGRYHSSGGYDAGYNSYAQSCSWRRARVWDGRGGWVWGSKRICY